MGTSLPSAVAGLIPAHALACVPGCEQGAPPLAASVLAGGGLLNKCLRVDTAEGRFVIRLRIVQGRRPGADGAQELRCQRAAAAAGLAPRVLAGARDASWVVMEFVDGALWENGDLQRREAVESLGRRLAQLHALPIPQVVPLDAMAIVDGQIELIQRERPAERGALQAVRLAARDLVEACASLARRPVLNHGDLNVANLIGPLPMLIDWEYAQLADPLYDVACLLTYYPQLKVRLDWLLGAAELPGVAHRRALDAHVGLFALLNELWGQAQGGAHGDAAGLVAGRPAE